MDPQTDLPVLVEDLEVNIDELSTILQPLLSTPLHTTASSLPLLDKAKLYVLAAYSIESLLFSTLQASGVNAKEHAIFSELARLKGYFGKIKEVEERGTQPKQRLDVGAAQRFIKHGLAGNDRYDLERAERMAKERARAALKAKQINKKFDEEGKETAAIVTPKKRAVEEVAIEEDDEDEDDVLEGFEEPEPATKKARIPAADLMDTDSAPSPASQVSSTKKKVRKPRGKKNPKQSADNTDAEPDASALQDSEPSAAPHPKRKDRKKKAPKKSHKSAENSSAEDTQAVEEPSMEEETILPKNVPKTRSEMFNSLLDGSLAEKGKKGKGKGKGKGK
ncbi:Nn.00g038500.m01.CDS01 [Neocucurbitaria sp. VM-36]